MQNVPYRLPYRTMVHVVTCVILDAHAFLTKRTRPCGLIENKKRNMRDVVYLASNPLHGREMCHTEPTFRRAMCVNA